MSNVCSSCGVCCKLFMINLSEEEYNSKKYKTQFSKFSHVKDFVEAEMCGANIIQQKKDGSCFYLKNNKCSIHKSRPIACRNFFCTSKNKAFKGMIEDIKKRSELFPLFLSFLVFLVHEQVIFFLSVTIC